MNTKIVLIDYSQYGREKVKQILNSAGNFTIIEFPNSEDFFAKVNSFKDISLIIIDIALPTEKEGFDVLSAIRNNPATAATPIVVVTRSDSPEHKSTVQKYLVSDFISKPYTSRRLESSVKFLIKSVNKFDYNIRNVDSINMSFHEYIKRELKLAQRTKRPLSIILISTITAKKRGLITQDNFDYFISHAFKLLKEKTKECLRTTDVVVSNGSNDILIVLPGTNSSGAEIAEHKIRSVLKKPLSEIGIDFHHLFYPVWVTFPDDGIDFNALMESAFKKISSKEMLDEIASIPENTRTYVNKLYTRYSKWF